MEHWYDRPVNDLRWDDLCTKAATGQCTMCDVLLESKQFIWFWFKGGCLRAYGIRALLTIVSLGFLVPPGYAWWLRGTQYDQTVTCQVGFQPRQQRNGYLEIQLTEQHPIEPVFSGKLYFISVDPGNAVVPTVTVTRSEKRTYARTIHSIATIWDSRWNILRPRSPEGERFDLVAETGGHRDFPHDAARFEFELDIDPPLDFRVIRIRHYRE
jgi:hypothetical protein